MSTSAALAATLLSLFALPSHAAEPAAGSRELDAALRAIIEGGPLAGARAGVLVSDVESGQVLYAKDADVLLNPASNVKLVTSAAALARLGPEYRFSTEFLVDPASKGSPSVRALHVRGKGDPTLVTERLWAIAGDLAHLGLRRIGDVVVDESFFDDVREGPGFDQESGDRSYLAPAGAASLNWNTVAIHVAPAERKGQRARVELEPASDFLEIENRATTVGGRGARHLTVSSVRAGGRQRIVVEGRIPLGSRPQVAWKRIDEPGLYLGHTLKRLLQLRGVAVTGRVRLGEVPQGARLVHVATSDALADVVRRLNKTSNNFVAEQLIKTLGAEVKGTPGTWGKGVAAAEEFLAEIGVPRGAYVMKNGSGLNDTNRFSARQLVTLLRAMWKRSPLLPEYLSSLPVAGRDGTIRWRMEGTEAVGRLRAKTGTLVEGNVTSLSGYVETAGRRTLAFSVLVNDYPGRPAGVVRSVDAIGSALAASGGPPGRSARPSRPRAARRRRPPPRPPRTSPPRSRPTTPSGAPATSATCTCCARRSAPRPSPPSASPSASACTSRSRTATPRGGRSSRRSPPIRRWSRACGSPAPTRSRARCSRRSATSPARGCRRRSSKLVELAPASAADGALAAAIADVLAEVAAAAPEELVAALRAAPGPAQDAALGVLGSGLGRSEERDHPFLAALRALAAKEGEAGAFARSLEPRVQGAIAAGAAARAAPALVPAGGSVPARAGGGG